MIIYKEEFYRILGACFEVYKQQGPGFLESVYQECLELEFADRAIPFKSRVPMAISYKHSKLNQKYIPDFLCYEKFIVGIKAVKVLSDEHRAQTINYLKATNLKLGVLVNFCHFPKLEYERLANYK